MTTNKYDMAEVDWKKARTDGFAVTMSVDEARQLIDEVNDPELMGVIDEAQGAVHSKSATEAYVIIKIER